MTDKDPRYDILMSNDDTVAAWEMRYKNLRLTNHWSEMMHEEHAVGFTVARVAKLEILTDIADSLDDVIRNGGTFQDWKRGLVPKLKDHGWWGEVTDKSITGTDETIIVNEARLERIYDTNVRMSMKAGKWRKIQRSKDVLPYLRYLSDHFREHPRKNHESWHGLILHVDDPTWEWMFPQNGWGCKCNVQQISLGMIEQKGWKISEPPPKNAKEFVVPATGEIIEVPDGIQPGFGYNPGQAHLAALNDKLASTVQKALNSGIEAAADSALREIVASRYFEILVNAKSSHFPIVVLMAAERALLAMGGPRMIVLGEGLMLRSGVNVAALRLLPDMMKNAVVIANDGPETIIYFREGTQLWRAMIRQDAPDIPPMVTDYKQVSDAEMEAEIAGLFLTLDRR